MRWGVQTVQRPDQLDTEQVFAFGEYLRWRLLFGWGVYSAGMGIIQTPNLRSALQSIQRDVDERVDSARVDIGEQSVKALKASRLVNSDTGRMKRGFGSKVVGKEVEITNSVEYAKYVERRYRGVERTLRARRSEIVRRVNG